MSRRDLSVKGGTNERCYRTRRGRTDEQRYVIIRPYFDGRIKMNGPYPEITNISFLAKLFFKTFTSLKHLSDCRTVGLSDCQIIATAPNYKGVGSPLCRYIQIYHLILILVELITITVLNFPFHYITGVYCGGPWGSSYKERMV